MHPGRISKTEIRQQGRLILRDSVTICFANTFSSVAPCLFKTFQLIPKGCGVEQYVILTPNQILWKSCTDLDCCIFLAFFFPVPFFASAIIKTSKKYQWYLCLIFVHYLFWLYSANPEDSLMALWDSPNSYLLSAIYNPEKIWQKGFPVLSDRNKQKKYQIWATCGAIEGLKENLGL